MNELQPHAFKFDRDDFTVEIDQIDMMTMENLNSITDKMRAVRTAAVERGYTVYEWFDHDRFKSCVRFVRRRASSPPERTTT